MKIRIGFLIAFTAVLSSLLGFYIGRSTIHETVFISPLGENSIRQAVVNSDWEDASYSISIIADTPEIFVAEKTMKSGLRAYLFNSRKRILYVNHIQHRLSMLGPAEEQDYR